MQEFDVTFRGYAYIWAETEQEAEKIFRRRFKKAGVNGEVEHCKAEPYEKDKEVENEYCGFYSGKRQRRVL